MSDQHMPQQVLSSELHVVEGVKLVVCLSMSLSLSLSCARSLSRALSLSLALSLARALSLASYTAEVVKLVVCTANIVTRN